MAQRNKESVTLSWPIGMKAFLSEVVYPQTRVKTTQISEIMIEDWLKKNGWWEKWEAFQNGDIL